jgi:CubicO group peptidase (beta-lactamase class C family)
MMFAAFEFWPALGLLCGAIVGVLIAVPVAIMIGQRVQLLLVSDPTSAADALRPENKPEGVRDLAELLEPLRQQYKVPALAAAVVQDDRLTALGAVGVRRAKRPERVTSDDGFHLGSCTKAMTATLCGLLIAENKLRWDSTIEEVFPDLAAEIAAGYRATTLEQLLTHRGGIDEGLKFRLTVWPQICELKGPLDEQRRSLIPLVLKGEPATAPGTAYHYSNCGYTIAGAMCERVTGKTWEDLIRDRLFGPLGMTSVGFGPPGSAEHADQPWGHQLGFWSREWTPMPPGPEADNPAVIGPAGTVHCSLADWAKFARLHLRGANGDESFLPKEIFQKLHQPLPGSDYAGGWTIVDRDWAQGSALTHGGSNTMWFCTIWLAPKRNIAFLAATNLGTSMASHACDAAVTGLLESISP